MNKQEVEQFFSQAKTIRLSASAKHSGREALRRSMAVQNEKAIPSHFSWLSFTWARASSFAAFAILLSIGGTVWAAEKTLPGDALYGWKTKVNEPVRLALLSTPDAKAEWSLELFTRRLEEAESLASAGRLDTDLQTFIEERLNEEREYVDDYGQSAGEEERVKIKTEIQERSGRIVRIEVREEEGRLRIRVREPDEVEERKEGRDDKREDESRPEDGEREEAAGRSDNQDEKSGDDKNESVERDPSAAQKKEESSQSGSGTKSSAKSGTTTSGSASQSTTSSQGTSSSPSQEDNESSHEADEDQESNTETYISESSARSKALAAVPGMVKDSDLKEVDNKKVWEVRVQRSSDNEEVKVLVDAKTGSIVKIDD